jgi:transposase
MKSKKKKPEETTMSVDGFAKSIGKSRLTIYKWIRHIKAGKKSKKRNGKVAGFPDGANFEEYLPGKYIIKVKD